MRLALVLPLSVSITVIAAVLAGCGGGQADAQGGGFPAPPVGVASPIARELSLTREFSGRIEAVSTVDLKPRVSGTVQKVLVSDGAEVKAGEVLLEIDDQPSKAALARAEANAAAASARLNQAQQQFERSKRLVADKVVSQQNYDDAEAGLNTAKAEAAAAAAALDSANLDLGYCHVAAPIAGRIGKVLTTPGNLVQGGGPVPATLLLTLVSIDPIDVSFDLDETTWRGLGERLRASGSGGKAVPVQVGVNGETGFPHQGQVNFVDNQIDSASGAIRLRARLPNAERQLTPGAFARVQLELAPPRPVLLVHERAIQAQLTTRYVFTVGEGGVTAFQPVQLGESVGPMRVVTGVAPDAKIAVNNLAKIMFHGMPVVPVPASMETLQNDTPPAAVSGAAGAADPHAVKSEATPKAESKARDMTPEGQKKEDKQTEAAKPEVEKDAPATPAKPTEGK